MDDYNWPTALVIIVGLVLWAANVRMDSWQRHTEKMTNAEVQTAIVVECANAERPKTCAADIRQALEKLEEDQ